MDPITVGADTDIELRDGRGNFSFIISGKPHLKNGSKTIAPQVGFVTLNMTDGTWRVAFVQLSGPVIGVKGHPTEKKTHFIYTYGFGHPDEEQAACHPDYAPPQWLTDFVSGIQDRLSGKVAGA